ncbi:chemotaxis protein CheX [Bacillus sp. PS06]|uniref:chemotaxis protein CheX n=1 Tax=Bacillus sp. PS06 TaxID=2764176 RepID=UPI001781915A|nr:chemotaxis protein CheX [Bacillus sp. PS06]MBD8071388.1 chemotaxis protein CheX [Bacillus sp. PS06]
MNMNTLEPSNEMLINEIMQSINSVIPAQPTVNTSQAIDFTKTIELGVSVEFTGDLKGNLFLNGERETFSTIAEMLYGMRLDGEMLTSFTGEVGNMIAGNLSTNLTKFSLKTDITFPVLMEENAIQLEDKHQTIGIGLNYESNGAQLDVVLLLAK